MKLPKVLALLAPTKSKGGGSGKLAPLEEPKVKNKQVSLPSHMTSVDVGTAKLRKTDLNLANVDIVQQYRFGASTSETLRLLAKASPELSGAVAAHMRMGIPEKYIPPCYNPDGTFNVDATRFCIEFLNRMDKAPGWETGFTTTGSVRTVAEALAYELLIEGACANELVLNKARQPAYMAPVSVTKVKFYDDHSKGTKTLKPVQEVGGEDIDLDIPNFFMLWLDPSLLEVYPHSPMESAIQPVLASQQFINDLRRLCQRHVYPRYIVSLDEEKLKKLLPQEALVDDKKRSAFYAATQSTVEDAVNTLGVEEALIVFDFISVEYIKGQDADIPATFEVIKNTHDGKVATGAKSMPSVLGFGSGTQNIASTETMLAMITANGMIRLKLMEQFSKNLTLACRLMGMDVTCNFEYDDIDLRPVMELEAFKAQKQSRLKEQLSLGVMGDDEFCLRTTGRLAPGNLQALSGTMFMDPVQAEPEEGNDYSGTGAGGGQSGGGAATQSRKAKSPTKTRGQK